MVQLNKVAVTALASGIGNDAIGHGKNGLAVARFKIEATMHAHIA